MPKTDFAATKNLKDAGFFVHRDSYVDTEGHVHLEGDDKARIRPVLFKKWKNKCCVCGHLLDPLAPKFHSRAGAWHHTGDPPCDCVDCIEQNEIRCDTTTGRPCHAHGTVDFQRKAEAKQDFEKLYGASDEEKN